MHFHYFTIISPWKRAGPFIRKKLKKKWIPFNQKCFVPSLVEIGSVVLEKMKMWKVYNDNAQQTNFDQKSSVETSSGELKTGESKLWTTTYPLNTDSVSITCTYKDNFPYISFLPIVNSGQKYYHLFIIYSNKTFQVLIFETIHITESYLIKFLVNSWNHGKNWQDLQGQNHCKNVGQV